VHVWLASFPRSGNTLLRFALRSLYGVASSTTYAREAQGRVSRYLANPDSARETVGWLHGSAAIGRDDEPSVDVTFTKTHELVHAGDPDPAIYIVRDGRDVYVSYAHFAMQLDRAAYEGMSHANVVEALIVSRDHFGGWSTHVDQWTQRHGPTAIVRYEDLVVDAGAACVRACEEVGVGLPPLSGRVPGGDELKAIDPLIFRKGTVGAWREEMPTELEALFWSVHGETMSRMGYLR
jgi:hypothetical protein